MYYLIFLSFYVPPTVTYVCSCVTEKVNAAVIKKTGVDLQCSKTPMLRHRIMHIRPGAHARSQASTPTLTSHAAPARSRQCVAKELPSKHVDTALPV